MTVIVVCKLKDTQLAPTNRAMHLCKCNGVADLSQMCYHVTFGRSALKGFWH